MPRSRWDVQLFVAVCLISSVTSFNTKEIYMDSMSSCPSKHTIYDFDIVIGAHKSVAASNPQTNCEVVVEAGYTDTYFMLEIIQESISIADCGFVLNIYNGEGVTGIPLKSLSCGSQSTGVLYTKGRIATFHLRQPRDVFQPTNDFSLRIKAFRDPNAPEVLEGTSHLPVGAIIGIVLALVLLIAFIILLCWCFRMGKLPGMDGRPINKRRPKARPQDRSESGTVNSAFSEKKVSMDPSRNNKFNLNNQDLWDTMTNASQGSMASLTTGQPTGKRYINNFTRNGTNASGRGRRGQNNVADDSAVLAGNLAKSANNRDINSSQDTDIDQMYENYTSPAASSTVNRPGRQRRPQDENEVETKRSVIEKPKEEGPIKSSETKTDVPEEKPSGMLAELQRELSKRKSMRAAKETDINDTAPGGPSGKRGGAKALLPEEMDSLDDTKLMSIDQQSEPLESDKMSNPMLSNANPAIRASVNELRPRTEESPRTKKKKKKRKKSINDSGPRRHRNAPETGDEYEPDHPTGYTTEEPLEPLSKIPYTDPLSSVPLPPEALAPVFATDTSTQPHYYTQPDQYGYQPQVGDQYAQPQIIGYDGYGNAVYGYNNQAPGGAGGVPYNAQPTYYMQPDGQIVMIPPPGMENQPYNPGLQITDLGSPGAPGYTSTPSIYDPNTRHRSPKHGRKSKHTGALIPGGPAGTVLDDPNLPPPGTTMMRTGIDPVSGAQVNQVVWSDVNRDPTDPVGVDNPQITRKTMVRVTTKANEGGGVPDAPSPALQQMSFNAAQQLKTGAEPAFMSPSRGQVQGGSLPYMTPAPIYAAETPERENTGFYTGVKPGIQDTPQVPPSGPGGPRVHNAPRANNAFRNKITLSMEDESAI